MIEYLENVKNIKKIGLFIIIVLMIGSLASCDTTSQISNEIDNDAIISVGSVEPLSELVPGNTAESAGALPVSLVFSKLYSYDINDGSLIPEVAALLPETTDSKTFTFHLNQNWTFHNGESVTVDSFINAWNYTANAANAQKLSVFTS